MFGFRALPRLFTQSLLSRRAWCAFPCVTMTRNVAMAVPVDKYVITRFLVSCTLTSSKENCTVQWVYRFMFLLGFQRLNPRLGLGQRPAWGPRCASGGAGCGPLATSPLPRGLLHVEGASHCPRNFRLLPTVHTCPCAEGHVCKQTARCPGPGAEGAWGGVGGCCPFACTLWLGLLAAVTPASDAGSGGFSD